MAQFIGRGLGLIGSTFGAIANVLIVIFFAVFMAAQPQPYVEGFLFLVPRKRRDRAREVLYEIGNVLRRWLIGQSLLAVCVAFLTGAGLMLLGAPFAIALALLAGLMEFVPYIGPFVAAVPAILVGFAESPQLALQIALLFLGIQMTRELRARAADPAQGGAPAAGGDPVRAGADGRDRRRARRRGCHAARRGGDGRGEHALRGGRPGRQGRRRSSPS